jgi:site-specific recombinase XerD
MADRKINVAHFAFYRGWLEGLDLADLGERYLITGRDLPRAKQTLRWLQDELIAAARRSKPPLARLLKLSSSQIARIEVSQNVSLEDFQASVDPDGFYSEAELVALFEEQHGAHGDPSISRRAHRNDRLLKKLRETVTWLEGWIAVDPVPADPVNAWLDDAIAERLMNTGINDIATLQAVMKKHGQRWYRRVSKIGPVAAQRLQRWLSENKLLPTENLPMIAKPNIRLMALEADIVPLERLMLPNDLTGVSGTNRAYFNKIEARDDFAAIQTWLRSVGSKVHTVRSYKGQAERFLLWMVFERQKPLSSATTEDCISYRDFLDALDEGKLWFWNLSRECWIGSRSTPRWRDDWKPFSGPLAPTSQKQAVTILTTMCEWLVRQKYLESNPWDGVSCNYSPNGKIRADHSLTMQQWQTVIAASHAMKPGEKQTRLYLALIFAYGLGLRLSEIAAARMAMHKEQAGRPNPGIKRAVDGHGWDIVVLGKGGKVRTVPIPNAVMNALAAYGEIIGLGGDVGAWPEGYIIFQTLGDGSWRVKKSEDYARQPMSESQVYRMFKGHFKIAASRMETAADAGHLIQASTHWLRHTHATHALEAGAEIEEVQENLGHSSVAITAIYTHASRKRRKSAVEKLMAFAELS